MGLNRVNKIISSPRVGLDANIYIYAFNNDARFPVAIELLRKIATSKCYFATSVITITEFVQPLFWQNAESRIQKYLNFVSGNGLIAVVDTDKEIALKAAQLRAKYRLKTPDAIHLATAISRNCQIFVTADRGFKKDIQEIKVEIL